MWRRRGGHREHLAEARPAVGAAGCRHRGGHRRGADPHRGGHPPGTEAAPRTRPEVTHPLAGGPRLHAPQPRGATLGPPPPPPPPGDPRAPPPPPRPRPPPPPP